MKAFCPNCERESRLHRVRKSIDLNVRGENIQVDANFLHCEECETDFEDPSEDEDPLEIAYTEYRRRKGMVQPDEIRDFRKKYDLTQKELSELLGFGAVTLSRYENGALQDEAHDRILQLIMQPHNLRTVLSSSPEAINPEKRQKLIEQLEFEEQAKLSIRELLFESFSDYEPDVFSGYKTLDLEKLYLMIKFFCYPNGIFKTKLNKLLFYADFLHFHENAVSISGTRYASLPYGPVPDDYDTLYLLILMDDPTIRKEEILINDFSGEKIFADRPPDLSLFSPSEYRALEKIKILFDSFSSKDIAEFSHKEKGYQETPKSKLIPYTYADDLNV